MAVAVDGVLHYVETEEGDEAGGDQGYEGADPRGSVDAAKIAEMERDSAGGGEIAKENGKQECEKKTVAADALEEIGAGDSEDGAGGSHAATPAEVVALSRCVARTAR